MRTQAPSGFNVSDFYSGTYTFQQWEVFPGHVTNGPKPVAAWLDRMGMPKDLSGKRVLDIAPWNGFFTFECIRRGASEVISFGPDDPAVTGYNKTKELLEIDNCAFIDGSIYDLDPNKIGTFDVVLFLGLFYHLRHPLLALDRVYDVCMKDLFIDSPIIDYFVFDQTLSRERRQHIAAYTTDVHDIPLMYLTPRRETGDAFNWFFPNRKGLAAALDASGFVVELTGDDKHQWGWARASKGERHFTPNLEGFSPRAGKAPSNN